MDAIIERDNQWTYIDLDQARYDGESLTLYWSGSCEYPLDDLFNVYVFTTNELNAGFMRCSVEEMIIDADAVHNTCAVIHYNSRGYFTRTHEEFHYLFDLLDFFLKNEDKLDERTASPIWT